MLDKREQVVFSHSSDGLDHFLTAPGLMACSEVQRGGSGGHVLTPGLPGWSGGEEERRAAQGCQLYHQRSIRIYTYGLLIVIHFIWYNH